MLTQDLETAFSLYIAPRTNIRKDIYDLWNSSNTSQCSILGLFSPYSTKELEWFFHFTSNNPWIDSYVFHGCYAIYSFSFSTSTHTKTQFWILVTTPIACRISNFRTPIQFYSIRVFFLLIFHLTSHFSLNPSLSLHLLFSVERKERYKNTVLKRSLRSNTISQFFQLVEQHRKLNERIRIITCLL